MASNSVQSILDLCRKNTLTLTTAESCTGGMIAASLTSVAGASVMFDCGFVTYSNRSKQEMLGVQPQTLQDYGAVSSQTVREMVLGALLNSQADIAIATTGIAGPEGGTVKKPVGLVYIACQRKGRPVAVLEKTYGNIGREKIRIQATEDALNLLLDHLV